ILVGFKTRLAAYALALFCLVAGLIFHFYPSVQAEMINFMKNLAIAGGFLALSVSGPGAYSLDARRG
ncbi:MAG: DoxX family protein, partial [Salaquimonas sp.]